ncbi:MAG: alkaline phosphatase family protein [Pyrinomonadaceae bacterium]|nr:alkaline phosphatase family protein [Pyrinomonadaceae bacterium]
MIILFRAALFALAIIFLSGGSFAQPKAIKDLDPTVILISIDGFRYDYLEKYNPKTLRKLAKNGVRAKWMIPSFPTKTFPNHYTIATGLFPEKHGITTNNMYDPVFDADFTLRKREEVQNPRWWGGEPIWVTAEKQGQKAGAFFFPGTEAPIQNIRPTFWKNYDGEIPNKERVDTILGWLDLPKEKRPTLYTLYFSNVDDAGHWYSPDSKKTGKAVRKADKMIKRLVKGLKKRQIDNKVNLIIVSDHGMAPVPQKNAIVLDEMFDKSLAKKIFWVSEIVQIFPNEGNEDKIYEAIKSKLPKTVSVYRRSEIPARFRYRNNRRIAPIVVLPNEGSILVTRERFEDMRSRGRLSETRGSHGYDNELESMRALFIGHGAAFKTGFVSEPFKNVEIYNLMCNILGLKPAPNDGTFENIRDVLKESGDVGK